MSLWTLVKISAALCVMAVMTLTAMLAWHVAVTPLGGFFSRLLPDPAGIPGSAADSHLVQMLESPEMPDIDPGGKAFQKAHELLALGKIPEAREKLSAIVNVFPSSPSAPVARRIVGEINLDEILCPAHMEGKLIHVVKRGESLLGIAALHRTTIDCIMHLNSMMELPRIQPGDKLVVMPLDFRLLVEPRRKSLSLWQGGRFIRDYTALHIDPSANTAIQTTIHSKTAAINGRRVLPQSREYRAAEKSITLGEPPLRIRGWDGHTGKPAGAILLHPQDMEEITLLTRTGNEVEIR
jgi:hypothetical protein